ncbi:MAG: hypothetical protein LUC24_07100 [Bacteroidales bacterium]|nr:hypothetical protein [Bacteroidales bacterium]
MKKEFLIGMLAAAGLLLLAGSCTREELGELQAGDEATVSFSLGLENSILTRAISDGNSADELIYAVFDKDGNLVEKIGQVVETDVSFPTTAAVTLAKGQTYQIAFWAQNSECEAYSVSEDMVVSVSYDDALNNDESRDAFFSTVTITLTESTTLDVILKRPFAQVNVGVVAADWEAAENANLDVTQSRVIFGTAACTLNLLDGSVSDPVSVEYSLADIPEESLWVDADEDGAYEEYKWLSMSYILVYDANGGAGKATTSADYFFDDTNTPGAAEVELKDGLDYIPVQRNWRTNIIGQILSGTLLFNISIDPIYDGDYKIEEGDGVEIVENAVYYYANFDTYTITSLEGLKWLSDQVNGANNYGYLNYKPGEGTAYTFYGKTVMLESSLDMSGISNWIPIGNSAATSFTGTFDGNNLVVNKLTVTKSTSEDAGDCAGLFGYIGGTIRNLVINNANVTGHKYVGAVCGEATGAKFYNITLNGNVSIEGYRCVGGVVGLTYGYVSDVTIDVEDGSYVKGNFTENNLGEVGGAVGYYGEHYNDGHAIENVVSNIDVNGSLSAVGGIVGFVDYGNSVIDCHSSGNVNMYYEDPSFTDFEFADMIGGIAGSWNNREPYPVYFENCSFTGTLTTVHDGLDLWANTIVGAKLESVNNNNTLYIDGNEVTVDKSNEGVTVVNYGPVESGRNHTAFGVYTAAGMSWVNTYALENIKTIYNDVICLTNDIDMTGVDWTPLGTDPFDQDNPGTHFIGALDGGGHTIKNLTITGDGDYVGLFGYLYNFSYDQIYQIKNLTVENATVRFFI